MENTKENVNDISLHRRTGSGVKKQVNHSGLRNAAANVARDFYTLDVPHVRNGMTFSFRHTPDCDKVVARIAAATRSSGILNRYARGFA